MIMFIVKSFLDIIIIIFNTQKKPFILGNSFLNITSKAQAAAATKITTQIRQHQNKKNFRDSKDTIKKVTR